MFKISLKFLGLK